MDSKVSSSSSPYRAGGAMSPVGHAGQAESGDKSLKAPLDSKTTRARPAPDPDDHSGGAVKTRDIAMPSHDDPFNLRPAIAAWKAKIEKRPALALDIPSVYTRHDPVLSDAHYLAKLAGGQTMGLADVPMESRSPRVCEKAVERNPRDLYYVPSELRTVDMALKYIRATNSTLDVPKHLLKDHAVCMEAAHRSPKSIGLIMDQFAGARGDDAAVANEAWRTALKKDAEAIFNIQPEHRTTAMYQFVLADHPDMILDLPSDSVTEDLCKLALARLEGDAAFPQYSPQYRAGLQQQIKALMQELPK